MNKKVKILFDISHGIHGSTGIQQDMRRILMVLLNHDEFEIDLLVYDMINNVYYNTFNIEKEIKKYGELIAQSRLVHYFTNPVGENVFQGRIIGRIKSKLYRENLSKKRIINYIKLDKRFNEVIYRKLLKDEFSLKLLKKLFTNVNILMADFSTEGIILGMMKKNYTPPYLDTKDYDIAIFFQELPIQIFPTTKKIVRTYDLIQILSPDVVFKADYKANYQYNSIKFCIQQNSVFCTISNTVSKQLKQLFGENLNTKTIPVAISDIFKRKEEKFSISNFVKQYISRRNNFNKKIPKNDFDYFLSVSTIEPRKNISSAYQAFKKLKISKNYKNLKFVLVGKIGWNLDNTYYNMFIDEDVLVLENVPTSELPYLYSNAKALIYIPFQEGFGIPPAEAMACGCPVILSDISVHREIHNDGLPFFVNPYEIEEIMKFMKIILDKKNQKEIENRVQKGIKHSAQYSIKKITQPWERLISNLAIR